MLVQRRVVHALRALQSRVRVCAWLCAEWGASHGAGGQEAVELALARIKQLPERESKVLLRAHVCLDSRSAHTHWFCLLTRVCACVHLCLVRGAEVTQGAHSGCQVSGSGCHDHDSLVRGAEVTQGAHMDAK